VNGERRPTVALIVAVGRNGVIGRDGKLPWHLPSDLKRFKAVTMGKAMIMGRKTYESIGRPLPGRRSIVLTRQPDYQAPGCVVVGTVDEALAAAAGHAADEVMVIGGAAIYRLFWPLAERLYLTQVAGEFEGEAILPAFELSEWREVPREEMPADSRNPYATTFLTLERQRAGRGRPHQ
jgi:dihydrofolate reductase